MSAYGPLRVPLGGVRFKRLNLTPPKGTLSRPKPALLPAREPAFSTNGRSKRVEHSV
jgi:hypothetical protein